MISEFCTRGLGIRTVPPQLMAEFATSYLTMSCFQASEIAVTLKQLLEGSLTDFGVQTGFRLGMLFHFSVVH